MITGPLTVTRPSAPGVAPGTALPAGPQGATGAASTIPGPSGPQGPSGPIGPQGNPTTINGKAGATITLALSDLAPGPLPTTLPATAGVFWSNGGIVSIS